MNVGMNDLSQKYNNFTVPEAVVWIDGEKLSKEDIFFSDVEINKTLDGADTFSFTVADAIDLEFNLRNETLFALGNKVEIHIGYADSSHDKSMLPLLFVGLITKVTWNFGESEHLNISLEGSDYSFLFMKHSYKKPYKEVSISDVVEQIIEEVYPIFTSVNIASTDITYTLLQNQEENDYLYFKSLAERIGYEFYVANESFYFQPVPREQEPFLTLNYGKEILSFKPELNLQKEVSSVKVVGLEFSENNEPIIGEASHSQGTDSDPGLKTLLRKVNTVEYEVREAVKSVDEANKRAASLLQNFSFNFFKAEITVIGIPQLIPGMTIGLEGLGTRFSRNYYVEKTVHTISDEHYETTLTVRSSASAFNILG